MSDAEQTKSSFFDFLEILSGRMTLLERVYGFLIVCFFSRNDVQSFWVANGVWKQEENGDVLVVQNPSREPGRRSTRVVCVGAEAGAARAIGAHGDRANVCGAGAVL
jgi:hypothetical protein